jgi:hypothetical protein
VQELEEMQNINTHVRMEERASELLAYLIAVESCIERWKKKHYATMSWQGYYCRLVSQIIPMYIPRAKSQIALLDLLLSHAISQISVMAVANRGAMNFPASLRTDRVMAIASQTVFCGEFS